MILIVFCLANAIRWHSFNDRKRIDLSFSLNISYLYLICQAIAESLCCVVVVAKLLLRTNERVRYNIIIKIETRSQLLTHSSQWSSEHESTLGSNIKDEERRETETVSD